jgi:DNA-binding transcriptional regulator YhcF (GntR family)
MTTSGRLLVRLREVADPITGRAEIPSYRALAERLGWSRSVTKRALGQLVRAGAVQVLPAAPARVDRGTCPTGEARHGR